MTSRTLPEPVDLARDDETAWLDLTAERVRTGRFDMIDAEALAEYLTDMAGRDRREVSSRLVVLLVHLLKWEARPARRSGSWLSTILEQQRALRQLFESGTLLNHAVEVFPLAYSDARKQASAETEFPRDHFPAESPWALEQALADRFEGA